MISARIRSFFRYYITEKIISFLFGLYTLYLVIRYAEPGFSNYVVTPILAAVVFYWVLAILLRKRRFRVRQNKQNTAIAMLGLDAVDAMSGQEFEDFTAWILEKNEYYSVQLIGGSGDQGVDIIAEKEGCRYAIQCKCYSSNLGNTPIQEVVAGSVFYGCERSAVITNSRFTAGAKALAKANAVLLLDRDDLIRMLERAGGLSSKKEETQLDTEALLKGLPPDNIATSIELDQRGDVERSLAFEFNLKEGDLTDNELYEEAVRAVTEAGYVSTKFLQRHLKIGYLQASRLLDRLVENGIISERPL